MLLQKTKNHSNIEEIPSQFVGAFEKERMRRRRAENVRRSASLPDNCLPGDLDLISARARTHTHAHTHTHTHLMLLTWTSELVGNLMQTADTSCL